MEEKMPRLRAPSGKRIVLSENIPLKAPLSIRISPSSICNFKCEYCPISLEEVRERQAANGILDFGLFQKIADNIQSSFGKVKRIMLVGAGEPLLNGSIAEMVQYINQKDLAEAIEITTNGTMLSNEMSKNLIDAGLSLLRVSVNGLTDQDFRQHCGAKVDFEKYVEQIRYFYNHRKNTKLYVKIINYLVNTKEKEDLFLKYFKEISDLISIENLIKADERIHYESLVGGEIKFNKTQSNTTVLPTHICSMPFYTLQIDEKARVFACCCLESPQLGSLDSRTLLEIWNNEAMAFQKRMLDGVENIPICKDCSSMQYRVYPEDYLDDQAQILKCRYDELRHEK